MNTEKLEELFENYATRLDGISMNENMLDKAHFLSLVTSPQFQQAIEREWISVKEGLPKENEQVIVAQRTSNGLTTNTAKYDLLGKRFLTVWTGFHGEIHYYPDITHWQPLPQPPITERKEK